MLREGDEEGYLSLLQKKKDARLEMLLQQTADFLSRIGSMVELFHLFPSFNGMVQVQLEKNRAAAEMRGEKAEENKEDPNISEAAKKKVCFCRLLV